MRNVRGILIDPFKCEITEVEHDASDYKGIYKHLSHESMPVDLFTVVNLDDGDAIFVDDEGLLKPCDRFFVWAGYHQPLAGKGLILGSDDEGETQSVKIAIDKVKRMTEFLERHPHGLITTATPWRQSNHDR